ncbi:hypothetical protein D9O36_04425 [Zobellia amurskyensis]|uniref:Outer membrane protein beta-barrel domain-containing protein n=1 Tax=Zobellia amurskyensis TaxID=248905 RepID=A0A7X2ZRJ5_9FLAO|nr:outer membrane beta-barrel protein [Zobellia amurskyensis]MUH35077.1 hypothetical protein [Zobellia amurskyensis]
MSKKNIDNLFQEKFRDFEEIPDDKVWNAIEASLDKKKKKRVVPIWWTMGGAAAALVVALVALYTFSENNRAPEGVTDTEIIDDTNTNPLKNTNEFILEDLENPNKNVVISSEKESDPNKALESPQGTKENRTLNTSDEDIIQNNAKNRSGKTQSLKPSQNTQLVQVDRSEKIINRQNNTRNSDKGDYVSSFDKDKSPVTASDNIETNEDAKLPEKESVETTSYASTENNKDDGLKTALKKNANTTPETVIAKSTTDTVEEKITEKKSIFDEIETEEEIVATEKSGRWSAGPNIAPVYYNAIGEGSPVNSIFNENSKSGNTNFSYGLTVAYALNDKLSIRSGLNKVDYGYDTNDVGFSSTLQEASTEKLKNIDYSSTAKNIVVTGQSSNFNSLSNSDAMFAFEVSSTNSSQRNGTMAQQFGYLEVPLELDYALIDSKFGLNILGGVSSLFLIDNSVTLTSGELTTEIGEANNVNSVNFSTNIGFGVNYKFTPKIRFNVEPVFKYQLNTFSDVSGDFRPFSIGVYSGLNFKF